MKHIFDVDIAKEYGVPEAIILENLYYWIIHNKANNVHFHEGRYWTYNSVKAFEELFPYYSKDQIYRYVAKLKEQELIVTGNFNKAPYDRTLWYALTDKGMALYNRKNANSILQNCEMENVKSQNENCEIAKPIPNVNPLVNSYINSKSEPLIMYADHIHMTEANYQHLIDYANGDKALVDECIYDGNEYRKDHKPKSKKPNDYTFIKNWVKKEIERSQPSKVQKPKPISQEEQAIIDRTLSMTFDEETEMFNRLYGVGEEKC